MIDERKDFLINEYSDLNRYVSNAWTISYSVLSGGVLLFGFLVTQLQKAAKTENDLYAVMLVLVPTVLSLVLGQLTSAVYFFYFRMLEIAKEFNIADLWHRWDGVLREASKQRRYQFFGVPRYAASFPLAVVLYTGTVFTPCYVYLHFREPWSLSFLFALLMVPVNLWLTYKRLVPLGFYKRIEDDFGFSFEESRAPHPPPDSGSRLP